MRGDAHQIMNDGFIRRRELKSETGLSPSTIDRLERRNLFPARRRLTPGGVAVGWLRSEVAQWRQGREKVQ